MYNKLVLISGFYIVLYWVNIVVEEYVLKCKVFFKKKLIMLFNIYWMGLGSRYFFYMIVNRSMVFL